MMQEQNIYENFKKNLEAHKPTLKLIASFIVVFFVGFGSGNYQKNFTRSTLSNYSTNKNSLQIKPLTKPENLNPQATQTPIPIPTNTSLPTSSPTTLNCLIKGNISSTGKKIYHMPNGAFYKTVKPEQCFQTENLAQAAGFTKSSR